MRGAPPMTPTALVRLLLQVAEALESEGYLRKFVLHSGAALENGDFMNHVCITRDTRLLIG